MAYAHDVHTTHGPSLLKRIGASLLQMLEALMNASQANRCRLEAERLERLSDDELAQMGLEREQIVMHVFKRYMYM